MERRYRLRRSREYARVRADGRSWPHRLVVLIAHPNPDGASRFGFVASKRLGTAVERNRAKRLLREAVRQSLPFLSPGWSCVLIARSPLLEASLGELSSAVCQLFQRAGLWRERVVDVPVINASPADEETGLRS